jgi:type I restriction enzyme S subunit
MCTNQGFKSLIPGPLVDSGYLYWFLKQAGKSIEHSGNGTTFTEVSKAAMERVRIPLPPLAEQRRIADLLDRADTVQRKREESRRLVDELLRSVFLEMFGDPVRNEKGWEVVKLQDLSDRIQIGPFGSLLHDSDYINGGVPLINPMHIRNGRIIVDEHRTVTQQKAQTLASYRVVPGEIILGRRGEMGRCAIIEPEHSGFLIGTGSLVIRPDGESLLPEFLQMTLSSTATRGYLDGATQGATMPNLNRKIVAGLPIALPPVAAQRRFVELRARILAGRRRYNSALQVSLSLSKAIEASCLGVSG